jgi:pSer/pThr/pTyr-binding forkhead associated (FHA) protein
VDLDEHTAEIAAFQGATAPRGRLVLIARDGGAGPSYPILDQLDIGRTEGDVLLPEDRTLATRHARITRRGSTLFVRDLGSVNGVYKRVRPGPTPGDTGTVRLRDQDLILVGQQVLRFEIVKDGEDGLGPAMQHGTLLFGTPVTPLYARLCQRTTAGVTRDVFHLHKPETVLGRESGDIVFTDDPFLSRRHASITVERKGDAVEGTLSDLESSNGTFLRIHAEVELHHGDEIRVGQQLFRIDLSGTELSTTLRSEPQGAG